MAISMEPSQDRTSAFSCWLDVARAAAALAVLFYHGRVLFIRSPVPSDVLPPMVRILYLMSNYGHKGVMIFFVLSGFLVSGSVVRAVRADRWSWRNYAVQRMTRLYIVLIPALALTLIWDSFDSSQVAQAVPNGDPAESPAPTVVASNRFVVLLGNATFLQTILVPTLRLNNPLWSLANEFWYYVLFPLLWLGVTRPGWSQRLLTLAAAAIVMAAIGSSISTYFVIWLLGAAAWLLPMWPRLARPQAIRLATTATLAALAFTLLPPHVHQFPTEFAGDFALAAAFALVLYVRRHSHSVANPTIRNWAGCFADFSYTLYITHMPPLLVLRNRLTCGHSWDASSAAWAALFGLLTVVTVYAYLVSRITESHTDQFRQWVNSRLVGTR